MGDWIEKELSEIADIAIGGTPSRGNKEFWDTDNSTGNYWVSIKDLNTKYIHNTNEKISDKGVNNSNAKLVKAGTVLMSFKLSIGKVAIAGADLYTNEAIAAFETKEISDDYLYYGLQEWDLLQDVDQAIKGATLNKQKLKRISVYFPSSKVEQSTIATILSTVDAAIEKTEQLIAKYESIKTGLMQDLLTRGIDEQGNIRSEETHEFKVSKFANIKTPKDWKDVNMRDVSHVNQGLQIAISERKDIEAPNRYIYITIQYLNDPNKNRQYIENPPKSVIADKEDIIFTRTGNTGQIVSDVTGVFHNNFFKVGYDKSKVNKEYLIYFLRWEPIQTLIKDVAGTTTIPDLKHKDFYNLPFFLPHIDEQERVVNSIKIIDESLRLEENTLKNLKKQKTALLQDLLTGKVRVDSLLEVTA